MIPATEFARHGIVPFLLRVMGWGCSHDDYTVPMRLPGETELTVSCLECGARLRYDWERMALADGRSKPARQQAARARATETSDPGPALEWRSMQGSERGQLIHQRSKSSAA